MLGEPTQEQVFGDGKLLSQTRLSGRGPSGQLPLTPEALLRQPSGHLFGMTQSAGMGWNPAELDRPHFLLLSTQGGLRDPDGSPVAIAAQRSTATTCCSVCSTSKASPAR